MGSVRQHLLDFRAPTITQMFSLYSRIVASLFGDGEQNANEVLHLSQQQRQNVCEEICDVYLGYLYDQDLRQKLIHNLVAKVFNQSDSETTTLSILDP